MKYPQIANVGVSVSTGASSAVVDLPEDISSKRSRLVRVVATGPAFIKFGTADIVPVNAQDETDYDDAGSNGDFTGGADYVVSDTITLSDGSVITVDAVSTGAVTEFTVDSSSAVSNPHYVSGDVLTQDSTDGAGSGFTLTLGDANLDKSSLEATSNDILITTDAGVFAVAGMVHFAHLQSGSSATLNVVPVEGF